MMNRINCSIAYVLTNETEYLVIKRSVGYTVVNLVDNTSVFTLHPLDVLPGCKTKQEDFDALKPLQTLLATL